MPTYVYDILTEQGKRTGQTFEVYQPIKDDAWERVPRGQRVEMSSPHHSDPLAAFAGKRCQRVPQLSRVQVRDSSGPTAHHRSIERKMREQANAEMTPRTSRVHHFPTRDVAKARQAVGSELAGCIQTDGRVQYTTLAQERKFRDKISGLHKQHAQTMDTREGIAAEARKKGVPAMQSARKNVKAAAIPDKVKKRAGVRA